MRKLAPMFVYAAAIALALACSMSFAAAQENKGAEQKKQEERTYFQKAIEVVKGKSAVVGACTSAYPVDCGDFCCEGAHGCGGSGRPRCYGHEEEEDD